MDYKRFRELAGRDIVLCNNSMNTLPDLLSDTSMLPPEPMKLLTLNLFDPFSAGFSGYLFNKGLIEKMLINTPVSSKIMKIRLATAADFMWNTVDYDPDVSLWSVLVSLYGTDAARELYRFNDAYFSTLASRVALRKGWDQPKHLRIIGDQRARLKDSLGKLEVLLRGDPALLNELKNLTQSLEGLYEKKVRTVAGQILAAGGGM